MVQMLVYLHSNVILTLDVLPQKFHLVKREHGQNAANDGQTIDVVLFFIGPLLEVPGDGAKTVQNIAVQSGNRHGALVVSVMQVRLGWAGNAKNKTFNCIVNCWLIALVLLDLRSISIQLFPVVKDVGQAIVLLGRWWLVQVRTDDFLLLQRPVDYDGVCQFVGVGGKGLGKQFAETSGVDDSELGQGGIYASDVRVHRYALL